MHNKSSNFTVYLFSSLPKKNIVKVITISILFWWIECKEGWYGRNCSQPCVGHCTANTTCNHVTGLCDGGCGAGWNGYKCDESKSQSTSMLIVFFRRLVLLICHN